MKGEAAAFAPPLLEVQIQLNWNTIWDKNTAEI